MGKTISLYFDTMLADLERGIVIEDIEFNNVDECIMNLKKIKIGIPKDYFALNIEKGTKELAYSSA